MSINFLLIYLKLLVYSLNSFFFQYLFTLLMSQNGREKGLETEWHELIVWTLTCIYNFQVFSLDNYTNHRLVYSRSHVRAQPIFLRTILIYLVMGRHHHHCCQEQASSSRLHVIINNEHIWHQKKNRVQNALTVLNFTLQLYHQKKRMLKRIGNYKDIVAFLNPKNCIDVNAPGSWYF